MGDNSSAMGCCASSKDEGPPCKLDESGMADHELFATSAAVELEQTRAKRCHCYAQASGACVGCRVWALKAESDGKLICSITRDYGATGNVQKFDDFMAAIKEAGFVPRKHDIERISVCMDLKTSDLFHSAVTTFESTPEAELVSDEVRQQGLQMAMFAHLAYKYEDNKDPATLAAGPGELEGAKDGDNEPELATLMQKLEHVERIDANGAADGGFAFVGIFQKTCVVGFPGTKFSDLNDIMADIKSLKTLENELGGSVNKQLEVGIGFYRQHCCLCEAGLLDAIKRLWIDGPAERVALCGHSLGGALATVCAVELANTYPERRSAISTWTYGSPRVFGSISADLVHNSILDNKQIHRFVNYGDIFPSTPASVTGFKHVGYAHYINFEMWAEVFTYKLREQDFSPATFLGASGMGPSSKATNHPLPLYRARLSGRGTRSEE